MILNMYRSVYVVDVPPTSPASLPPRRLEQTHHVGALRASKVSLPSCLAFGWIFGDASMEKTTEATYVMVSILGSN